MLTPLQRIGAVLMIAPLVVAACSQQEGTPIPATHEPKNVLRAEVGTYDIAVGDATRVVVGLFTGDELFVSYGTVDMVFSFLGREERPIPPEAGPTATARFLLVPGTEPPVPLPENPVAAPASDGRGVYAADVVFDRAGFWEVAVRANVGGRGSMRATSAFEVLDEHQIPAPGDRALKTENLTLRSDDVPRHAVDSRWRQGEKIPDPELHTATISDAIDAGRPAVVVFSTPLYCASRLCGPITDMVHELAHDYGDRADFIHVEIWRNHEKKVLNQAAADWLLRDNDLREPWVFFIGADGRIQARWANVATREEIEPLLRKLPPMSAAAS